ncbi:hypothetical protein CEXT_75751 [Caerostris extrusa]|uniref:Uncharacterized protein n=1 Tax=Caerostris extrusa TaxID=172846 RepID=A0AAV4NNF9_CAEEX|nr:hypothetical protein CEXT_75751 [Caerostris extrusa]
MSFQKSKTAAGTQYNSFRTPDLTLLPGRKIIFQPFRQWRRQTITLSDMKALPIPSSIAMTTGNYNVFSTLFSLRTVRDTNCYISKLQIECFRSNQFLAARKVIHFPFNSIYTSFPGYMHSLPYCT